MSDLDLYKETILEEAAHPVGRGKLADHDGSCRFGNASCGDMFTAFIKLDQAKKTILAVGWEGEGCAISTAAMSLVSQHVIGTPIEAVSQRTYIDVGKWLGLEVVSPGRIACVSAGLRAVQKAVQISAGDAADISA